MSKRQKILLKAAFFVGLFIVGLVFHDAILGIAA